MPRLYTRAPTITSARQKKVCPHVLVGYVPMAKDRIGRPPMRPGDRRSEEYHFRVSPNELRRMKRMAKREAPEKPVQTWMRDKVLRPARMRR